MILTLNFVFLRLQGGLNQRLLKSYMKQFQNSGERGWASQTTHSRLKSFYCIALKGLYSRLCIPDVPPGINVTCSIPNQMNLHPGPFINDVSPALERNGKIDKHSATYPLCRVPFIVALARLIFLKPNSFKNQKFYLANCTGVHCQTSPTYVPFVNN